MKEPSIEELKVIAQPTNEVVISAQAVIQPEWMTAGQAVEVKGYVDYDKRRDKIVAARFGGRIEKLYVKYDNQYMRTGEKVMEIYSPEISTAQEEYLYLLKSKSDRELLRQSTHKLSLLGLTDAQINALGKQKRASSTVTIFSQHSGYIRFQVQTESSSTSPGAAMRIGNMGSMQSPEQTTVASAINAGRIREGSYVSAGQTLFIVNDLATVWGVLAVENASSNMIRIGTPIRIRSELLYSAWETKVEFIEPTIRQGQKFLLLRTYLHNRDKRLKINSLLTASIFPSGRKHLMIVQSAVYDLGYKKIAWLATGRKFGKGAEFRAVPVLTGAEMGDKVEIRGGLNPDAKVAKDAGFMVDRESFIKIPER